MPPLSLAPPTMTMLPSADSATEVPWRALATAPVPTSLSPCCVQTPPLRVNTHAAPAAPRPKGTERSHGLSPGPRTMAVLPSAERATDAPWDHNPPPYSLVVPTSLPPCCLQPPPLRVNTHAAPTGPTKGDRSRSALLGPGPPTMAVLPSAERATDMPWLVLPTAPTVPTSFGRCWKDCAGATCPTAPKCRS